MIVVHTQYLENYGAHAKSGKFADDNHYWKMKGGRTFVVDDLDRPEDAIAFIMAGFGDNTISWKEYPIKTQTLTEWLDSVEVDAYTKDFYKDYALYVSPKTGTKIIKYSEWEDMMNAGNEMNKNQYEEPISYYDLME